MDEKFNILRHPKVSGTADGKAGRFQHGAVTGSVASLVYDADIDLSKLPKMEAPDGDYELLFEEDLEESFKAEEDGLDKK